MSKKIEPELRQALRLIGNGVFVIATKHEGQVRGFTATWVMQASYDHPLLVLSIARDHDTYPLIEKSGRMVVNVLAASQTDVAVQFGRKTAKDPTSEHGYFRTIDGIEEPILEKPLAYLKAEIISSTDARDHTVFVAEVVEAAVCRDEEPLLYWPSHGYVKR